MAFGTTAALQATVTPAPSTRAGQAVQSLLFTVTPQDLTKAVTSVVITAAATNPTSLDNFDSAVVPGCSAAKGTLAAGVVTVTPLDTCLLVPVKPFTVQLFLKNPFLVNPAAPATVTFDVKTLTGVAPLEGPVAASYAVAAGSVVSGAAMAPLPSNKAGGALTGVVFTITPKTALGAGDSVTLTNVGVSNAFTAANPATVQAPQGCPITSAIGSPPWSMTIHLGTGCALAGGKPAQFVVTGNTAANAANEGAYYTVSTTQDPANAFLGYDVNAGNPLVAASSVKPTPALFGAPLTSLDVGVTPVATFSAGTSLVLTWLYDIFLNAPAVTGPTGCSFTSSSTARVLQINLGAGCTFADGQAVHFTVSGALAANPRYSPVYYTVTVGTTNVVQTFSYELTNSGSEICSAAQSVLGTAAGGISTEQRVALGNAIVTAVQGTGGQPVPCTIGTTAGPATVWFGVADGQQAQTFTSPDAPPVTVTYWGTTVPVIFTLATLPPWIMPNTSSCVPAFVVFIDRMNTTSYTPLNNPNPVVFQVGPLGRSVHDVLVSDQLLVSGVPVGTGSGSWTTSRDGTLVTVNSPKGVFFVGCTDDDSSPWGLLGLLGLIAIPVCCCCLPLLVWCCRRRKVAFVCCPPQPAIQQPCQELYFVQPDPFYPSGVPMVPMAPYC